MNEVSRIIEAYARRDASGKSRLYSTFNPEVLLINQQRERGIIKILKENDVTDLANKRILDVGCGKGGVLRDFIKYGAQPELCYGIDILPDRIEDAKKISPNISFRCGNAEELQYDNGFFDIILLFTVFTSIFDIQMKKMIVKEILRVLNEQGMILWYDYHINNPFNRDVKAVKKKEIYDLFPGCAINLKRITLAPPLARTLAPHSVLLAQLLEKIPLFCTHYLGVIKKK
jgi:ubiquinone/menaquinone biosynthesis C-methylase UbiE